MTRGVDNVCMHFSVAKGNRETQPRATEYLLAIDLQYDYSSYVCSLKGIVIKPFSRTTNI